VDALVAEVAATAERIEAQVIMMGIGFPHQQRVAMALLQRRCEPSPLIALLGGSFDLFTGRTTRAPHWMRRHGLEWAYRVGREPRRLARRYLVDDLAFVPLMWRAKRGEVE
jgi:exopolysaccharide biosynthesis WecB/TagA/CpsF family protein